MTHPTTADPEHAWKTLNLVNDWIKHAESKGGATLAAAGVGSGVLYELFKDLKRPGFLLPALGASAGFFFLCSAIAAALALRPRLRSTDPPVSGLYFDHIARQHPTAATYGETLRLLTSDPSHLIDEISSQVWANAHVAHRKFFWSGLSVLGLIVGGFCLAGTALDLLVK